MVPTQKPHEPKNYWHYVYARGWSGSCDPSAAACSERGERGYFSARAPTKVRM
jgi:hypothetical protein